MSKNSHPNKIPYLNNIKHHGFELYFRRKTNWERIKNKSIQIGLE